MKTLGLKPAALLCKMHPNTLRELAVAGKAPGAKPARAWVFVEEDLLAFLRGQYKSETPCRSTKGRAARSGGQTSAMLANGYVNLLERQIAAKRKSARTSSR